jgi:hypothetical protein
MTVFTDGKCIRLIQSLVHTNHRNIQEFNSTKPEFFFYTLIAIDFKIRERAKFV